MKRLIIILGILTILLTVVIYGALELNSNDAKETKVILESFDEKKYTVTREGLYLPIDDIGAKPMTETELIIYELEQDLCFDYKVVNGELFIDVSKTGYYCVTKKQLEYYKELQYG